MKARKETHEMIDVHAELYHRNKIEALRAEGERLRKELILRGVDPGYVLVEAGLLPPQRSACAAGN